MFKDNNYFVGFNGDDLVYGYTKRLNGVSPYPNNALNMALYVDDDIHNVNKNQEKFESEIEFSRGNWVLPNQRHGNNIAEIKSSDVGKNVYQLTDDLMDIDAMYTYERGILLAMNFADCTPLFLYSTKNDFVGLAHAGWKGTKLEVLKVLLDSYEGDIEDLQLLIGVAINKKSYEVDETVVNDTWDIPRSAIEKVGTKYLFDLKEINKYQALKYGLKEEQVHVTDYGTEMEQFFSYRLENGQTGRALAFIGRRKRVD